MIRLNQNFLACSLFVTAGGALLAASFASAQDIAACRKVADDKERLACFDRASQVPPPPTASPTAAPISTFNPFAYFGRDTAPSTKPEEFGRSSLPPAAPKPPAAATEPPEITSITAKVTRVIDPDGKPKFVLDNGQVWGALNYVNINPRDNGKNTIVIETSLIGYLARLNDSFVQFNVRRLK
jgi:hypothetical protein